MEKTARNCSGDAVLVGVFAATKLYVVEVAPWMFVNWLTESSGYTVLEGVDRLLTCVPWLRANGGLVIFEARRGAGAAAVAG